MCIRDSFSTLLTSLGFEVVLSEESTRDTYYKGQQTIPSDTVCYPAKLCHGHIESLLDKGVDFIFYPCMSYNADEGQSDNHYNCPVVASPLGRVVGMLSYPKNLATSSAISASLLRSCLNVGIISSLASLSYSTSSLSK